MLNLSISKYQIIDKFSFRSTFILKVFTYRQIEKNIIIISNKSALKLVFVYLQSLNILLQLNHRYGIISIQIIF